MPISYCLPHFFEVRELLVEEMGKQFPCVSPAASRAIPVFAEDVGLRTALFRMTGEMVLLLFFRIVPIRR